MATPFLARPGRAVGPTLLTRVAAAAVVLSVAACAPLRVEPSGGAFRQPTFPAFAWAPDRQPTISSGRAGWPIMAVDPNVYVDDEGYHLFYSTLFCRREHDYSYSWDPADHGACNIDAAITSIAYAFSNDRGLTWQFRETPVVMVGDSGFDAARIETAAVFRRGDTLYVAYAADGERDGRRFTARYEIGLARLALGRQSMREAMMDETRQFERRATPLLPLDLRAGRFDNNVQEPSVVIGPDGIVLYYIGLGLRLPDQPIDAAGQGIVSVGLGRAVLDEHLNVVSRSASAVLEGVNITEVRYFDDAYHVFATTLAAGESHQDEAISYATSWDGVSWTTPTVILSPGSVPGFNDWGLMAPTVGVERNRVILFYTAFGTASGACLPLGPDGRFGLPVAGGSKCMFPTIGRAVSSLPSPGSRTKSVNK